MQRDNLITFRCGIICIKAPVKHFEYAQTVVSYRMFCKEFSESFHDFFKQEDMRKLHHEIGLLTTEY